VIQRPAGSAGLFSFRPPKKREKGLPLVLLFKVILDIFARKELGRA